MFVDKVVVGHTFEALLYSFINDCYFIQTSKVPPYFYLRLGVPCLGERNLKAAWTKLRLIQSFLGKAIVIEDLTKIRIEGNTIKLISSGTNHKYEFGRCYVFESIGLVHENEITKAMPKTYRVIDDLELRRVGKGYKKMDSCFENRDLASQMHFYTSNRIDGADYITDCVTESKLTQDQLHDFEYSDTIVRFIVERYLASINIRGKVVGLNKNGSCKYHKPEVKHVKRIVTEQDNNMYKDSESVKFFNMTLQEVLDGYRSQR